MDKLTRLYRLHQLLAGRRVGVPLDRIMEELECSRATANRVILEMRTTFMAPIMFDREQGGYRYDRSEQAGFELPGVWFSEAELKGLLSMQRWLDQVGDGFVGRMLAPLGDRMRQMLGSDTSARRIEERVVLQEMGKRNNQTRFFAELAAAALNRTRLKIVYRDRTANRQTERVISPQRLVHYRDNWYLDAFCHLRNELRRFAVDRVNSVETLEAVAVDIETAELERLLDKSYGIFGGESSTLAVLCFVPETARWVAEEIWHPEQSSRWLPDGRYELTLPVGQITELAQDILRYGAGVEVVAPPLLRDEVRQRLMAALVLYPA